MENWKIAFDEEGQFIVTAGELGMIKFIDIASGEISRVLSTADIFCTTVAIVWKINQSKNGRFLAAGNSVGQIFVFDLQSEKKPQRIEYHGKTVRGLCFASDSLKLLSCSDDQHINVIDL